MKDKINAHFELMIKAIYNGREIHPRQKLDLKCAYLTGILFKYEMDMELADQDMGDDEVMSKMIEFQEETIKLVVELTKEKLKLEGL